MRHVPHFLIVTNLLIETDIDAFRRPGTGRARPFVVDPKEMYQIVIQDVWPLRTPPKNFSDPCLLRQN